MPEIISQQTETPKHQLVKRKIIDKITIGESDKFRRSNLLKNAKLGFGKAEQRGNNISYIVGNDDYGFIEYIILNANVFV